MLPFDLINVMSSYKYSFLRAKFHPDTDNESQKTPPMNGHDSQPIKLSSVTLKPTERLIFPPFFGRVVNTSNTGSGGPGFKPRPSRCFLRQGALLDFVSLHTGL